MAFQRVCSLDDLWEGDMAAFDVGDTEVLLIWPNGGEVRAVQAMCPHQDIALAEGQFDGKTLVCRAHLWQFDPATGKGVNPTDCALALYPTKVEGDDIFVDVDGIQPLHAAG